MVMSNHPHISAGLDIALTDRVVDLMDVLDAPERDATGDLDLLTRVRTPGALELLSAYERMTPDARSSLVTLLRNLNPQTPSKARQVA